MFRSHFCAFLSAWCLLLLLFCLTKLFLGYYSLIFFGFALYAPHPHILRHLHATSPRHSGILLRGYHDIKMIFIQSKSLRIGWNVLLYHFHYKELPSICLVSGSNIFHRSINALWKYRIGWIVPDKLFTFLPIGRFNYIDNNMNQIFNDRIETSKWYS